VQKLVTIYVDNHAYMGDKWLVGSFSDKHGLVEEHLAPYLDDGWKVVSLAGFGGGSDGSGARGWLAVVIEK
jgi:hypothetical protein